MALVIAVAVAGCEGSAGTPTALRERAQAPLPARAPSIGPGPRYRPVSLGPRAARGLPIGALRCTRAQRPRHGVHVELFAARRVVRVAPGIGVAPPRQRSGAYVSAGRCSYPVRTREPTGVVEVEVGAGITLGHLFAVWGQPLARGRLAGFRGRVRAYVGGRPWQRDPRRIPLRRHAQIVLEVGRQVQPHRRYRFPPGL